MKFITNSRKETIALGKKIGRVLKEGDVVALQGTLGAGKTTITIGIAEALGVKEIVTSPTFCLINEYQGKLKLYHIDAYRLESADDFLDLGVSEMLYGEGVTVIEWSEKVLDALPPSTIFIKISTESDGLKRVIEVINCTLKEEE